MRRAIVLVWMIAGAIATGAQNLDINILKEVNPEGPNSRFWAQSSNSVYWAPAGVSIGTLIYGLFKNDKTAQANAGGQLMNIGICTALTSASKYAIDRTRPEDRYPGDIHVVTTTHGYSFPSGHTSTAFTMATTLSLQYRKWYVTVPAYAWAGSVGYSRMYLGKHYPSDVMAGALVGTGSALVGHWLSTKIFYK